MHEFSLWASLMRGALRGATAPLPAVVSAVAASQARGLVPPLAVLLASLVLASGPVEAIDLAYPDVEQAGMAEALPGEPDLVPGQTRIGEIRIHNQNVFDPDNPKDNKRLFRLANLLHVRTREHVIRDQLLFRTGEDYDPQAIEETERILRNKRYIYDASVTPAGQHEGVVDVDVQTQDVWTLNPAFSFGRHGGKNTSSFGIKELNLLGTGVQLGISRKSGIDRDSTELSFLDPNLGSSWVRLGADYSTNSDGYSKSLTLERPFYALDSRWSAGIDMLDEERVDSLYERGEIADEFNHRVSALRAYTGWSAGLNNGWVRRWTLGAAYSDEQFLPVPESMLASVIPEDRRFVYPFIGYELIEDEFRKTRNHDQIDRTEDFYLGTCLSAELGFAPETFGSDRNAIILNGEARSGWQASKNTTWLFSGGLSGRLESGSAANTVLGAEVRYYRQQSEKRLLFASLGVDKAWNLDFDNPLVVGGNHGLRGYPLRYQSGDKRALFSIEQRYFTDWYPFRLFHVGGAVFFDAGKTWGTSPIGDSDLGLLKDVGLGLRLAGSRSGHGRIVHMDLAFPLDGDTSVKNMQFIVETKTSF